MFRQLLPTTDPGRPVDLAAIYAGDEYLRVNMVTSIDGAATVSGRVGGLTGELDQQVLTLLRDLADVLLVGAGTIRAEGYGPIPGVRLAIVTNSADLDLTAFAGLPEDERPWIITHSDAPADRLAALGEVAQIKLVSPHRVDLTQALAELRQAGHRRILTEGGPELLGDLIAADLLTEFCLTTSPQLAGGTGSRIVNHPELFGEQRWELASLLEADGELFARYLRVG